jgi:TldD protein
MNPIALNSPLPHLESYKPSALQTQLLSGKVSANAASSRLLEAQKLLLTPFGLTEAHLSRILSHITQHRVDDADLYFQTTRSEGWSLEEGIVKTGSFSIDQGVGVRAVSGEKTAFAYSDDISWDSLLDAATTVRSITSAMRTAKQKVPKRKLPPTRGLYGLSDPIGSMDSTAKVQLLERVEQMARAKDPRVVQVMASLSMEHDVVMVARANGILAADIRPLVRLEFVGHCGAKGST